MDIWSRFTTYLDDLLRRRDEQRWQTRKWIAAVLPLLIYFPILLWLHSYIGNISLVVALIPSIFWGVWLGPTAGSMAAFMLINPHYLMFLLIGETLEQDALVELLIAHIVFATVTYFITNGFHLRKNLAMQLEASQRAEARFRGLFDRTADLVLILDLKLNIIDVNDVALILLGYRRDELLQRSYRDIVAPEDFTDLDRRIALTAGSNTQQPVYELTLLQKDGSRVVTEIDAGLIGDALGKPLHYQVICRDIRERKAAETALYQKATQDTLTGLYNRSMFFEIMARAIKRAKRSHRKMAVIFLDLDGFKKVNDTHGHHMGDEVLKAVAERINKTVRSTDAVARLGGDEFAVVVEDLAGRGDALQIADTLEAVLSEPFVIEQLPIRIGASSGVSLFPDDDETAVGLLNTSDMRMYQAKRKKYETKPGMAPKAKLL